MFREMRKLKVSLKYLCPDFGWVCSWMGVEGCEDGGKLRERGRGRGRGCGACLLWPFVAGNERGSVWLRGGRQR